MTKRNTDYLIIGNSAAGVTAAEYIRAHDSQASLTILSREPYAVYGRPLISYVIEGKTTEEKMGFKDADFYESHNIEPLLGPEYEAVELRPDAHEISLASGETIGYKKCLLATGSIPFTPPIKGLEGKRNVYTFLTLDDAKAAWSATVAATEAAHASGRGSKVLVIGAGLIGLKAAEALSHHADQVLVLELAAHILPAVLDNEGAVILQQLLEAHGITCMPGISADELYGEGDYISGARLTDGKQVTCDLVIAAVGVRPNSALAVDAGAQQGRGLICGTDLQTSLPDVYAAGDVVQVNDLIDKAQRPLALWQNAILQGKTAGLHMVGAPQAEPFEGNFAINAVDFFDFSLLTAGVINPAENMGCEIEVRTQGVQYAKFVTREGMLVGYILLNRPQNAGIYTSLIEQHTPLSSLEGDPFGQAPLNMDFPQDIRWTRMHKCYPSDRDERGWKERV